MAFFGGAAAPTPAAPSTGFFFATGPTPAATPATTPSPGFATPGAPTGGGASNPTPTAPQQQQQQQSSNTLVVPDFDAIFPNLPIQDRIERHLSKVSLKTDEGRWEQQVLISLLQCNQEDSTCVGHLLAHPKPLSWTPANPAVRNQLQINPVVTFQRAPDKPASLTPAMLQEVWSLADDLRVTESEALALYAQASKAETRNWLKEEELAGNLVVVLDNVQDELTVPQAARQLYFCESHSLLHTLLLLIQKRFEATQHLGTWGSHFLRATDTLLQKQLVHHLIALIRDYTQRDLDLQREIAEAKSAAAASVPFYSPPTTAPKPGSKPLFQKTLLEFVRRERQVASECLFFLAYHTQCSSDEVAALIDLVKDLTNQGLPGIDPFDEKIIPAPFQEAPVTQWQAPPWAPAPIIAQPAKDPLVWQQELVRNICQTGQPQLLQSVSVLVLTVLCALDSQHELMDRTLHGPNPFGVGNALLPPGTMETNELAILHERLAPNSYKDWIHRKDIFGLFSASYALLLRSVPTILTSPRVGPTTGPGQATSAANFKVIWRHCLEAPTELKSFTFARLTLLPALRRLTSQQPVMPGRNDEFFFSVLAEWTSRYLEVLCSSGDVPISRAQWVKEGEDELALRRSQQEQQQQFRTWSGVSSARQDEEQAIPAQVDLMTRPDCMDDVIALAVAVCATEPDCAFSFWSTEERQDDNGDAATTTTTRLVPSRALRDLERLQQQDRSLLPSYLSFLAALALVKHPNAEETGAAVVHRILSNIPENSNGAVVHWTMLMDTLRYYARELSPQDYTMKSSNAAKSSSFSASSGSTAYYYGANNNPGSTSSGFQSHDGGASSSSSSGSKSKELGDANTFILSALLAVISNVACKLADARSVVLGIKLPVEGSEEGRQDTALAILFSLSIVPLTPELRGAVFATIATLLQVDALASEEQAKQIRELSRTGWDLLEDCQVLPIGLLDQYAAAFDGSQRLGSNILFPPSSISLVGDGNNHAWMPNDSAFGILFEMEHVESRMGWYPSTEGFLKLLSSLVSSCGCPYDLGNSKRARSGCSPYIEYVTQFVIARATAGKSTARLPFRMAGDKSRLLARAFEVVEAVLARYVIPPKDKPVQVWVKEHRSFVMDAVDKLGIPILAEAIVIPPAASDAEIFAYDFRNTSIGEIQGSASNAGHGNLTRSSGSFSMAGGYDHREISSSTPLIPSPKSPGFVLLADALSAQGGKLFHAIASTLEQHSSKRLRGGGVADETEAIKFACAFGLLGEFIPTVSSSRSIVKGSKISISKQALLKPIIPVMEGSFLDKVGVDDATKWRERVAIHALRIICAVAAREESFLRAVNSSPSPLNFAPILQFQRQGSAVALEILTVQPTLLKDLLLLEIGATNTICSVVDLIDYSASNDSHEAEISAPAVAFTFYLHKFLHSDESDKLLHSRTGRDLLTEAIAKRLLVASRRSDQIADKQIFQLILDWIVSGLCKSTASGRSISHRLLGLPTGSRNGTWSPGHKPSSVRLRDCLDAIIQVLRDPHPGSPLATKCYEIFARLCDGRNITSFLDMQSVLISAERLRDVDFWSFHLVALLAEGSNRSSVLNSFTSLYPKEIFQGAENVLHSVAWLLKGVASELQLLCGAEKFIAGVDTVGSSLRRLLASRPRQCEKLLLILFSSPRELLKSVLACIPLLTSTSLMAESVLPSKEAVEGATTGLLGPREVVAGYKQIDYTVLLQLLKQSVKEIGREDDLKNWVEQFNYLAAWDCASSHLSDAVRIVMGSALASSSWLKGEYSMLLSNGANDSSVMSTAALEEALTLILSRLIDPKVYGNSQYGMDDNIFSMASLYLSQASLLLAERVVAGKQERDVSLTSFTDSYFLDMCAMFARAVFLSSCDGAAYAFSRREERTAILGTSLASLLRSVRWLDMSNIHREHLFQAAIALSLLSSYKVKHGLALDRQRHPPSAAVIAARSCLSTMVGLLSDGDDGIPREQSFNFVILTRVNTFKRSSYSQLLVDLVANLDEHVSGLLVSFVCSPFGGELLLENGLAKALASAAESYAAHESKALHRLGTPLGGYKFIDVVTPSFFEEHLQIIKSLLSSPNVSIERRKLLADNVANILNAHQAIIERLFARFPVDHDVLLNCFECVALAEGLQQSNPIPGSNNQGSQQVVSTLKEPCVGYLELSIFDLTFHVLENPYPRHLLSQLPRVLTGSGLPDDPHMAPLLRQEKASWWEKITSSNITSEDEGLVLPNPPTGGLTFENQSASTSWTELKYEFCVRGLELAALGLSLLVHKVTHERYPFTNNFSIARSLCRVADAARAVEGRVGVLDQVLDASSSSRFDAMDTEDSTVFTKAVERKCLQRVGIKLGRCTELLLIVALTRIRAIKATATGQLDGFERQSARSNTELLLFSNAIAVALDYNAIDTMGVGCVTWEAGENRREFAVKLSKSLRNELKC